MPQHKVQPGECLDAIALRYGFSDWNHVYNHPKNEALRKKRPNPHLLHPGDVVFIPELQKQDRRFATGQTHQFIYKRPMRELRLNLRDEQGEPLRNMPYLLEVDGVASDGTTDGDGHLVHKVPVKAESAKLAVGEREWTVRIGFLNPVRDTDDEGISGVQARLRNLGFDPGPIEGKLSPQLRDAICSFEVLHGLEVTGEPSGKTLDKLLDVHGG
ncbi:peptidoglycan-binding protein [Archangium violaceum]|uniref:peptidoglycan-binding protein n=1 Tax=Archangium violaceum TaxID=83451 RepID=UPI00193B2028|nr:peptidoglycan-binding protein [Archangium violaceum]QRK13157.1 peptidoglycan-binding protein [Archangium violaceum]